jgi:type VI secretion system secreted protein Hcp
MAYDAFLKLTDIKGESNDSKHKGEIDVLSFSFGVSQVGTSSHGGGGGAGKASFTDLNFVHKIDQSSPVLFQKCATGEHLKDGLLTLRKAGGTQLEYLKIKLTDLLISSVQHAGTSQGGEDIPHEQVSLNFAKIELDYQPQGADGKAQGGAIHGGWDVKQNVKV